MSKPFRQALLLALIILATGLPRMSHAASQPIAPAQALFDLVDQLRHGGSLSRETLEATLKQPFKALPDQGNAALDFSALDEYRLGSELTARFNLRERRRDLPETAFKALLEIEIAGTCVTQKEVLARYPDHIIAGVPRGNSRNERLYFEVKQPPDLKPMKLSFGFAESNPDCLAAVILESRADQ